MVPNSGGHGIWRDARGTGAAPPPELPRRGSRLCLRRRTAASGAARAGIHGKAGARPGPAEPLEVCQLSTAVQPEHQPMLCGLPSAAHGLLSAGPETAGGVVQPGLHVCSCAPRAGLSRQQFDIWGCNRFSDLPAVGAGGGFRPRTMTLVVSAAPAGSSWHPSLRGAPAFSTEASGRLVVRSH